MDNTVTDNEFHEIAAKEHAKIFQSTTKNGYKMGIYDGRQSVFQKGFDIGYENGFKNAFNIGRFQGMQIANNHFNKKEEGTSVDLLLKKPTRGQCQICQDQLLINKDIEEVVQIQSKHSENVDKALQNKYGNITTV